MHNQVEFHCPVSSAGQRLYRPNHMIAEGLPGLLLQDAPVNCAFRVFLEANGYWVRHSSVLPFGVDYQLDISD